MAGDRHCHARRAAPRKQTAASRRALTRQGETNMRAVAHVMAVLVVAMAGAAGAAQAPAKKGSVGKLDIMLMKPAAAKTGDNQFEVMVKDEKGNPVAKADVALQFHM